MYTYILNGLYIIESGIVRWNWTENGHGIIEVAVVSGFRFFFPLFQKNNAVQIFGVSLFLPHFPAGCLVNIYYIAWRFANPNPNIYYIALRFDTYIANPNTAVNACLKEAPGTFRKRIPIGYVASTQITVFTYHRMMRRWVGGEGKGGGEGRKREGG